MELKDFVKVFVRKSVKQLGNLRDYMYDFTTYSAKVVAAGNLSDLERGRWFIYGLPIKYRRYVMEKTGAVADEASTLIFKRLKKAVELKIMAVENAKQIAVLLKENALNVQLIQEL